MSNKIISQSVYLNELLNKEMGYPEDLFLDRVSENLICPICLEVMNDPITLEKCQHYFCRECIETVIDNARNDRVVARCPTDRTVIHQASIRRAAPIIISIMDNLRMKCKFHPKCEEVILFSNANKHEFDCTSNPLNNQICERCSCPLTLATKSTHDCIMHLKEQQAKLCERMGQIQNKTNQTRVVLRTNLILNIKLILNIIMMNLKLRVNYLKENIHNKRCAMSDEKDKISSSKN